MYKTLIQVIGNFAFGAYIQGTCYHQASGRSETGCNALAGHLCDAGQRNQKCASIVCSLGLLFTQEASYNACWKPLRPAVLVQCANWFTTRTQFRLVYC